MCGKGNMSTASSETVTQRHPRAFYLIAAFVLSVIGLVALQQIASFVTPVFLGLNLVLAVAPLMHWLVRRGVPRILAGIIGALTVYVLLIAFVLLLIWSVAMLIQELPHYSSQFGDLYASLIDWLGTFGITQDEILRQAQQAFSPSAIVSMLQGLASNIGGVAGLLTTLLVVIFFIFFDAISFEPRIDAVRRMRPNVGSALDTFSRGVGRYWVVTTLFGVIVAVLDVIALEFMQVPLALVWGVFSFLTNYIPNIGFIIGLIPPTLMALLANGPMSALLVIVVWSLINFVLQSLIQPKVAGDAVGVTPTVSFISLLVWAFALGPVGALLALPATLLVKAVLIDADPDKRWIGLLLDAKPKLDDDGDGDDEAGAGDEPTHDAKPTETASDPAGADAHPEARDRSDTA